MIDHVIFGNREFFLYKLNKTLLLRVIEKIIIPVLFLQPLLLFGHRTPGNDPTGRGIPVDFTDELKDILFRPFRNTARIQNTETCFVHVMGQYIPGLLQVHDPFLDLGLVGTAPEIIDIKFHGSQSPVRHP